MSQLLLALLLTTSPVMSTRRIPGLWPGRSRVRRQGLEPRTRGLRVRYSAFPHVHRRPPVQVTVRRGPPWMVLDAGELQRKLQLRLRARIWPTINGP